MTPLLTPLNAVALFVAAFLAGVLNSVAGGGSFISFPALIFTGVQPLRANATSTVALWPGAVAAVSAYRELLGRWKALPLMAAVSLVGGFLGAELLINTPEATFVRLVPWLLLLATLLFAFGRNLSAALRSRVRGISASSGLVVVGVMVAQLIISIYGGYFGGGIGILMLSVLAVAGMENIHEMNAIKTVLQASINGVAVITFIAAGKVDWPQAVVMAVAAILGGYGGAHFAKQLDPKLVRNFVLVVAVVMTAYFFIKG